MILSMTFRSENLIDNLISGKVEPRGVKETYVYRSGVTLPEMEHQVNVVEIHHEVVCDNCDYSDYYLV